MKKTCSWFDQESLIYLSQSPEKEFWHANKILQRIK
ncbi:hypothetical protein P872_25520 [Rhodonellum psychrophilum GCM71 = DSM 17998]|uniref:Uncharacterized protein n=1 Tax=Rhodonellum psychrophilum GCM71 = DSM 17998 TaxID=1123057 RepID=U5C3Y1_9BACT|nr:hypothetical protein P872_25520 [Rhodonellum psychrophilum GCM71 = DSM 17998]